MQAINRQTVGDRFRAYLKHPGSLVLFLLVMLAAIVTFAVLVFLWWNGDTGFCIGDCTVG